MVIEKSKNEINYLNDKNQQLKHIVDQLEVRAFLVKNSLNFQIIFLILKKNQNKKYKDLNDTLHNECVISENQWLESEKEYKENIIRLEKKIDDLKSCNTQLEKNFLDIKSQFDNLNELNSELHDKISELQVFI